MCNMYLVRRSRLVLEYWLVNCHLQHWLMQCKVRDLSDKHVQVRLHFCGISIVTVASALMEVKARSIWCSSETRA